MMSDNFVKQVGIVQK